MALDLRPTQRSLNELFRWVYSIGLLPKSVQAEHTLIERYKDRVSPRLLARKAEIEEQGRTACSEFLRDVTRYRSPFLDPTRTIDERYRLYVK